MSRSHSSVPADGPSAHDHYSPHAHEGFLEHHGILLPKERKWKTIAEVMMAIVLIGIIFCCYLATSEAVGKHSPSRNSAPSADPVKVQEPPPAPFSLLEVFENSKNG